MFSLVIATISPQYFGSPPNTFVKSTPVVEKDLRDRSVSGAGVP